MSANSRAAAGSILDASQRPGAARLPVSSDPLVAFLAQQSLRIRTQQKRICDAVIASCVHQHPGLAHDSSNPADSFEPWFFEHAWPLLQKHLPEKQAGAVIQQFACDCLHANAKQCLMDQSSNLIATDAKRRRGCPHSINSNAANTLCGVPPTTAESRAHSRFNHFPRRCIAPSETFSQCVARLRLDGNLFTRFQHAHWEWLDSGARGGTSAPHTLCLLQPGNGHLWDHVGGSVLDPDGDQPDAEQRPEDSLGVAQLSPQDSHRESADAGNGGDGDDDDDDDDDDSDSDDSMASHQKPPSASTLGAIHSDEKLGAGRILPPDSTPHANHPPVRLHGGVDRNRTHLHCEAGPAFADHLQKRLQEHWIDIVSGHRKATSEETAVFKNLPESEKPRVERHALETAWAQGEKRHAVTIAMHNAHSPRARDMCFQHHSNAPHQKAAGVTSKDRNVRCAGPVMDEEGNQDASMFTMGSENQAHVCQPHTEWDRLLAHETKFIFDEQESFLLDWAKQNGCDDLGHTRVSHTVLQQMAGDPREISHSKHADCCLLNTASGLVFCPRKDAPKDAASMDSDTFSTSAHGSGTGVTGESDDTRFREKAQGTTELLPTVDETQVATFIMATDCENPAGEGRVEVTWCDRRGNTVGRILCGNDCTHLQLFFCQSFFTHKVKSLLPSDMPLPRPIRCLSSMRPTMFLFRDKAHVSKHLPGVRGKKLPLPANLKLFRNVVNHVRSNENLTPPPQLRSPIDNKVNATINDLAAQASKGKQKQKKTTGRKRRKDAEKVSIVPETAAHDKRVIKEFEKQCKELVFKLKCGLPAWEALSSARFVLELKKKNTHVNFGPNQIELGSPPTVQDSDGNPVQLRPLMLVDVGAIRTHCGVHQTQRSKKAWNNDIGNHVAVILSEPHKNGETVLKVAKAIKEQGLKEAFSCLESGPGKFELDKVVQMMGEGGFGGVEGAHAPSNVRKHRPGDPLASLPKPQQQGKCDTNIVGNESAKSRRKKKGKKEQRKVGTKKGDGKKGRKNQVHMDDSSEEEDQEGKKEQRKVGAKKGGGKKGSGKNQVPTDDSSKEEDQEGEVHTKNFVPMHAARRQAVQHVHSTVGCPPGLAIFLGIHCIDGVHCGCKEEEEVAETVKKHLEDCPSWCGTADEKCTRFQEAAHFTVSLKSLNEHPANRRQVHQVVAPPPEGASDEVSSMTTDDSLPSAAVLEAAKVSESTVEKSDAGGEDTVDPAQEGQLPKRKTMVKRDNPQLQDDLVCDFSGASPATCVNVTSKDKVAASQFIDKWIEQERFLPHLDRDPGAVQSTEEAFVETVRDTDSDEDEEGEELAKDGKVAAAKEPAIQEEEEKVADQQDPAHSAAPECGTISIEDVIDFVPFVQVAGACRLHGLAEDTQNNRTVSTPLHIPDDEHIAVPRPSGDTHAEMHNSHLEKLGFSLRSTATPMAIRTCDANVTQTSEHANNLFRDCLPNRDEEELNHVCKPEDLVGTAENKMDMIGDCLFSVLLNRMTGRSGRWEEHKSHTSDDNGKGDCMPRAKDVESFLDCVENVFPGTLRSFLSNQCKGCIPDGLFESMENFGAFVRSLAAVIKDQCMEAKTGTATKGSLAEIIGHLASTSGGSDLSRESVLGVIMNVLDLCIKPLQLFRLDFIASHVVGDIEERFDLPFGVPDRLICGHGAEMGLKMIHSVKSIDKKTGKVKEHSAQEKAELLLKALKEKIDDKECLRKAGLCNVNGHLCVLVNHRRITILDAEHIACKLKIVRICACPSRQTVDTRKACSHHCWPLSHKNESPSGWHNQVRVAAHRMMLAFVEGEQKMIPSHFRDLREVISP